MHHQVVESFQKLQSSQTALLVNNHLSLYITQDTLLLFYFSVQVRLLIDLKNKKNRLQKQNAVKAMI